MNSGAMKTFWRSPFLTLILVAVDAIVLARLWRAAYEFRESYGFLFSRQINPLEGYLRALPILLVIWLCVLARFRFYSHHERIAGLNAIGPVCWAVFWAVVATTIYNLLFKPDFGRTVVAAFAVAAAAYLFISRTIFRVIKRKAVERGHGLVRVLVVGTGELGRETVGRIREHPDIGFRIVGLVADGSGGASQDRIEGFPVLGEFKDVVPIIRRHGVEEVFLALPDADEDDLFHLIEEIQKKSGVVCKVAANVLYVIANRAKVDEIVGLPVIAFRGSVFTPAQLLAKRVADLAIGGVLALILSPVALLFALLIRLDSRGPVFFAHRRIGQGGRRFNMMKFRTMYLDTDPYAEAPNDQGDRRITPFGRFLRRTSLDEIPQLIHVLRGQMSLVGPRPEMPFIVDTYKPWQAARLRVKPGLTGLWQIAGRKNLPLHLNLEYDFYYVKNQSLSLDAEILLRTIPSVLLGKGAY